MQAETALTPNQHKYYGPIVTKLNRLKGETLGIFQMAIRSHWSHDTILTHYNERVRDHKYYKKLPSVYRREVEGYFFGAMDIYRDAHIEWVLYYDGKFVGGKNQREATEAMYRQPNFSNNLVKGFHVYIGTEDKF